ncbi:hypothetical protein BGZ93_004382 [Podila epicladia]|nr:hypothetical protein BGZ92_005169 [Podila epicladia]KAG0096531.1 hypothetical protein BGZ93_004382 [Podila epicladia]
MASPFNYPPPGGAPNVNSSNPLRPFYGVPGDSPLQSSYHHLELMEEDFAAQQHHHQEHNSQALTRQLLRIGPLKFLTLALAVPFENAQTLLQVQYMPTDDQNANGDDSEDSRAEQERRDEEFRRAKEEEEEEDDDYYGGGPAGGTGYYSSERRSRRDSIPSPRSSATRLDPSASIFHERKDFDQSGYLVRTDVYDDDSRPSFQLAPLTGGVWSTITTLAKHPTEGYLAPWKGHFANWVYEMLHLIAQPTLEATLNDTFGLHDDSIPLAQLERVGPNFATMVVSHVVVGFVLSPLELIRTRLVVQSNSAAHRKYSGIFNCLTTIVSEEGVSALWGGINLVPTLAYHLLTPLFTNSIPLVIERVFNIDVDNSPFFYHLADLTLNTVDLLIRLPVETVRKRLQLQIHAKIPGKRYETVVETRKRPYVGMIDAIYRIIHEEGGQNKRLSKKTKQSGGSESWYSSWAVRPLYTGLGMHLTTNVAMFVVSAIATRNREGDDY